MERRDDATGQGMDHVGPLQRPRWKPQPREALMILESLLADARWPQQFDDLVIVREMIRRSMASLRKALRRRKRLGRLLRDHLRNPN